MVSKVTMYNDINRFDLNFGSILVDISLMRETIKKLSSNFIETYGKSWGV